MQHHTRSKQKLRHERPRKVDHAVSWERVLVSVSARAQACCISKLKYEGYLPFSDTAWEGRGCERARVHVRLLRACVRAESAPRALPHPSETTTPTARPGQSVCASLMLSSVGLFATMAASTYSFPPSTCGGKNVGACATTCRQVEGHRSTCQRAAHHSACQRAAQIKATMPARVHD
eukprot:444391-Pleurochrysis_carterae.AAC.2